MIKLIAHYLENQDDYENQLNPPVDTTKIQEVEKELDFKLPEDYLAFLEITNGFEGFIGESYCQFLRLEEIVEFTEGDCKENFPWAVRIGGNGGGEMYVIDKREECPTYGIMSFIGGEEDLIPLGKDFEEFLKHLYLDDFWQ